MKLLEYLDNKVKKYQRGGGPLPGWVNRDVEKSEAEELVEQVKNFYLQHPTRDELGLFQKIFDVINRDPLGFFKLFRIKRVLPISSVNGVIVVIETRSKQNIIDNQLLIKIPQLESSDSVTYEYYVGQAINKLRINKWSDNFALVYGMINCGFNSKITGFLGEITKLKKKYDIKPTFFKLGKLEVEKTKLDLLILTKGNLCEGTPSKPHIIYEYLRNIKTDKTETFESYIKRLLNQNLESSERKTVELNIIKIMIVIMYSLQVAQDQLDFTHYDLHTGNILVIELEKPEPMTVMYGNKKFVLMLNVIPHIIDYGRSYVNPEKVDEIIGKDDIKKDKVTGKHQYIDIQLGKLEFNDFRSYQNALFNEKNYIKQMDKKNDIVNFNNRIFLQIKLLLNREGPGSELYNSEQANSFYIVKTDKKMGKYTKYNDRVYIIHVERRSNENKEYILIDGNRRLYINKYDENHLVNWLSENIYNKNIPESTRKDAIKNQISLDGSGIYKQILTLYDLGVHSNKANKKYDMFRLCKLVCRQINDIQENAKFELQYADVWDKLDDQLRIEYPFNEYFLSSDYHVTDFFNISQSNKNAYTQTWLKTPKDIAEYLKMRINTELPSENMMELDPEHSFQIAQ